MYRCQTCNEEFEIRQSFSDEPVTNCLSDCPGKMKKVFSGVGISFKGSGFYKNDHGSKSAGKNSIDTPKEDSKESESSSKTDKKPSKETKTKENAAAKTDKIKKSSGD